MPNTPSLLWNRFVRSCIMFAVLRSSTGLLRHACFDFPQLHSIPHPDASSLRSRCLSSPCVPACVQPIFRSVLPGGLPTPRRAGAFPWRVGVSGEFSVRFRSAERVRFRLPPPLPFSISSLNLSPSRRTAHSASVAASRESFFFCLCLDQ